MYCVFLLPVSETGAGQSGFDPSDFPMLSLGRGRQDPTVGSLMASANALARQGFNNGEFNNGEFEMVRY